MGDLFAEIIEDRRIRPTPSVRVRPWDKTHPSNWQFDSPEIRIDALEHRLEAVETFLRERFGNEVLSRRATAPQVRKPKKRGPTPFVLPEHLFNQRESIIEVFEFYWPELRVTFVKKQRGPIRRVLKEVANRGGSYASTAQKALDNVDQLVQFLRTNEWKGDPRMAASAMAGVPEIRWTTSLLRCRQMKSERLALVLCAPTFIAIFPRYSDDY